MATGLAVGSAGCSWLRGDDAIVVPEFPTAREQAENAERQYQYARATVDKQKKAEEFGKAQAAFAKVADLFPEDRTFTPAAMVREGEVLHEMEDFAGAERTFREAVRLYADIPDVHAGALFGLGDSLEKLGRKRESKDVFRRLIDTYSQSDNAFVRDRVERARVKYRQIL